MLHALFRGVIPACILLLPALPAAAASFALPENAVIDVQQFVFPPAPADVEERNLQGALRDHLVFSLQKAGFSVLHERTGMPVAPPAPKGDEFSSAADAALQVTPLEDDRGESDGTETDRDKQDTTAKTALIPGGEAAGAVSPDEPSTESPGELPGVPSGELPSALSSSPPASSQPAAPKYILTGRVTLLRENVGAPTRIAGDIRIRTEASLHVMYSVEDAATGKVIISDVASGSVARVTSETHDIDGALAILTNRVMADSASKIAASLSGAPVGGIDDDYYRDSPGKRLKPKK